MNEFQVGQEVKERKFYEEMPSVLPETLPIGAAHNGSHDLVRLEGDRYVCEGGVGCCWSYARSLNWKKIEIQPSPLQPETSGKWVPKVGELVAWEHCGIDVVTRVVSLSDPEYPEYTATIVVENPRGWKAPRFGGGRYWHVQLQNVSPPPGGSADVPSVSGTEAVTKPSGGGSSKADPYAEHTLRMQIRGLEANGKTPLETSRVDSAIAASRRAKLEQTKKDMDRPVRHPSDWECSDEPTNIWMNGRP